MRFSNRGGAVDPRLSKLLPQKNVGAGIVMNNLAGEQPSSAVKPSDSLKQRMNQNLVFSNNLTQKAKQLGNSNQKASQMMQIGFMTPMINATSQFNNRIDNQEVSKNRAALLAMGGMNS